MGHEHMKDNYSSDGVVKYFSMFSGVGGFELGIGDRGRCVGYSEIDKYAIQTYEKNWKGHHNYGDATKINERELPDFDLLVGGFPCQAFSIAGKRKGFDEARGTLFFDIARVLKHKRPSHFCLENVKGLLSHDTGKTFQTILKVLSDLGYGVEWQLLNGKRYVPQNRERIIIIGHLRDRCRGKIFPFRATDKEPLNKLNYVGAVMSEKNSNWLDDGKKHSRNFPQGQRVYATDGISSTIAGLAGGLGGKTGLYAVLTPDRKEKRQNGRRFKTDGEPMFTFNTQDVYGVAVDLTRRANNNHRVRKDGRAGTLDANYYIGLANQERPGVKGGVRIRRLTPLECERLMGWEDNWTEGVSDTQRYKQCGNGIIAPMVTEVITAMCNEGCLQTGGIS